MQRDSFYNSLTADSDKTAEKTQISCSKIFQFCSFIVTKHISEVSLVINPTTKKNLNFYEEIRNSCSEIYFFTFNVRNAARLILLQCVCRSGRNPEKRVNFEEFLFNFNFLA